MPRKKSFRKLFGKSTKGKILWGNIEFRMESPDKRDWQIRLNEIERKITDWTPVFKPFSQYMLKSFARTHASEGRPNKWKELAPSTVKQRGSAHPILDRTGKMKRSYRVEAGKQSFKAWNLRKYYNFHHTGTKKMPKRMVIQLLKQDKAEFTRLKNRFLGLKQ